MQHHRVRSMFASVQHYQPRAKRVLCLFGNRGEIDPSKESFDVVTLEDLNINNMHRPLFWYSVVEGSTFIKPECMRHMFNKKGVQRLIYFDNDILLFKTVDSIYDKLKVPTGICQTVWFIANSTNATAGCMQEVEESILEHCLPTARVGPERHHI